MTEYAPTRYDSTRHDAAERGTYQIRERIELLAHQTRLLAPPRYLAVHEVEEQAERDEEEGQVQVHVVGRVRLDAVPQRREDGHDAAEAWVEGVLC